MRSSVSMVMRLLSRKRCTSLPSLTDRRPNVVSAMSARRQNSVIWLRIWSFFIAPPNSVGAGYLDDNPDELFAAVYERLGALPVRAARDPFVWLRLEELKREPCDQKSVGDLALMLDKLGYRREAADGLFRFVKN